MKKYKIENDFYGRYDVYSRHMLFFWKWETTFYDQASAEEAINILKQKRAYKTKVNYY